MAIFKRNKHVTVEGTFSTTPELENSIEQEFDFSGENQILVEVCKNLKSGSNPTISVILRNPNGLELKSKFLGEIELAGEPEIFAKDIVRKVGWQISSEWTSSEDYVWAELIPLPANVALVGGERTRDEAMALAKSAGFSVTYLLNQVYIEDEGKTYAEFIVDMPHGWEWDQNESV